MKSAYEMALVKASQFPQYGKERVPKEFDWFVVWLRDCLCAPRQVSRRMVGVLQLFDGARRSRILDRQSDCR
jgi:hypothetical protein